MILCSTSDTHTLVPTLSGHGGPGSLGPPAGRGRSELPAEAGLL